MGVEDRPPLPLRMPASCGSWSLMLVARCWSLEYRA